MRTNPRLKYWDLLVDQEIEAINEHYSEQGGMIDRLGVFPMVMPYHKLSPDGAHHTVKGATYPLAQVLIHKFDICRKEFIPKFPPTTPVV
ncbi:hypothetical protein BG011_001321 [Mortierella polycephala]|uniref:Uncharacterized protein n=1 Tax=Mortierella polycephala TaxID=41804 RepID=A0A9P6TUU8_9FUNG|nr:hypothetical protein BG011_001321 [Mortierella polycephala]